MVSQNWLNFESIDSDTANTGESCRGQMMVAGTGVAACPVLSLAVFDSALWPSVELGRRPVRCRLALCEQPGVGRGESILFEPSSGGGV